MGSDWERRTPVGAMKTVGETQQNGQICILRSHMFLKSRQIAKSSNKKIINLQKSANFDLQLAECFGKVANLPTFAEIYCYICILGALHLVHFVPHLIENVPHLMEHVPQ
jgi:hypothetical protein